MHVLKGRETLDGDMGWQQVEEVTQGLPSQTAAAGACGVKVGLRHELMRVKIRRETYACFRCCVTFLSATHSSSSLVLAFPPKSRPQITLHSARLHYDFEPTSSLKLMEVAEEASGL